MAKQKTPGPYETIRYDRNGSLPSAYREIINAALDASISMDAVKAIFARAEARGAKIGISRSLRRKSK